MQVEPVVLPRLAHGPQVEPVVAGTGLGDDELDDFQALLGRHVLEALEGLRPHEGGDHLVARLVLQQGDPAGHGVGQRVTPQGQVADGDDAAGELERLPLVLGRVGDGAGLARPAAEGGHEDLEGGVLAEQGVDVVQDDGVLGVLLQQAVEAHRAHPAVAVGPGRVQPLQRLLDGVGLRRPRPADEVGPDLIALGHAPGAVPDQVQHRLELVEVGLVLLGRGPGSGRPG